MESAKYIVVEDGTIALGSPTIIIFPSTVKHTTMANYLGCPERNKVTSAGFISVNSDGTFQCHGESTSLKVSCNKERDQILAKVAFGDQLY